MAAVRQTRSAGIRTPAIQKPATRVILSSACFVGSTISRASRIRQQELAKRAAIGVKWQDILLNGREIAR
ncbi:hypothetical protein IF803_31410 [Bradyrhizobium sp. UFLA06-06]